MRSRASPIASRILWVILCTGLLAFVPWIAYCYPVPVAVCCVTVMQFPKVKTLLLMVLHAALAILLIAFDDIFQLPVAFPRTPDELMTGFRLPPAIHKALLRLRPPTPSGSEMRSKDLTNLRLERVASTASATLEPQKASSRAAIRVVGDGLVPVRLFIKTGDAYSRGLPLWLSALSSWTGNREVAFYRFLRPLLAERVDAPEALLAAESALLARWCLVLTDMSGPRGARVYRRRCASSDANQADVTAAAAAAAAIHVSAGHAPFRRDLTSSPPRRSRSPPNNRRSPVIRRPPNGDTVLPDDVSVLSAGLAEEEEFDGVSSFGRRNPLRATPRCYVVPDRTGCTLSQALAVVRGLATLHSAFWGRTHLEPGLAFLTASRHGQVTGYVPAPAVGFLLTRALPKLPKMNRLWKLLLARLSSVPVAIVHGDCRPENLLFQTVPRPPPTPARGEGGERSSTGHGIVPACASTSDGSGSRSGSVVGSGMGSGLSAGGTSVEDKRTDESDQDAADDEDDADLGSTLAQDAAERWRVTFLDWEAVGINPAANDLIYFMTVGLRADDAANWETPLLRAYQRQFNEDLSRNRSSRGRGGGGGGGRGIAAASSVSDAISLEELQEELALLGCVMLVVQAAFAVTEAFKGWGNHEKNFLPWIVRLCRYAVRLDTALLTRVLLQKADGGKQAGNSTADAGQGEEERRREVQDVLATLKQRAQDGLEKLRAEHGRAIVDAM